MWNGSSADGYCLTGEAGTNAAYDSGLYEGGADLSDEGV